MEKELASYATSTMTSCGNDYASVSNDDCAMMQNDLFGRNDIGSYCGDATVDGDISLFSIENQSLSFDATAAKQSIRFMSGALREIRGSLLSNQSFTNHPSS